jgi:aspartyl/asparaginyl beta-hydroxylase (cupin superfamily)
LIGDETVEELKPAGVLSLEDAAQRAMAAGDVRGAASLWRSAVASNPKNISGWMKLAACHRALGDVDLALQAVDGALAVDPRMFLALLMKASLLERAGRLQDAGPAYGTALLLAPPDASLDPPTLQAVKHGREINKRYGDELSAFLKDNVRAQGAGSGEERRVEAFIDFILGRRKNYRQEPVGYFYPGLPAIEFWERDAFPWLEGLEHSTDAIRHELAQVMAGAEADFVPYINYADTIPIDQWAELNRSRRWSGFHLLADGKRVEDNCIRCPETMAALAKIPQPIVPNRSPAAMFSALDPRTHIPPHTGVANTRLVVHLPLIVPEGCRFRVGNEIRTYQDRRAWVFDDTIEHEAWNDSDEPRIILLFDVWNPLLSPWEREMIAAVSGALDTFNGGAKTGLGL